MTTAARASMLGMLFGGGWLLARVWRARRTIDFAGKTVVILGGSRGLGLVLAREFASAGARLVLVARDPAELERARAELQARGAQAAALVCDIRDRGQIERTIERLVAEHGVIDVLVNNAGIIQVGPLEHMTAADFEDAMATHFWGPLWAILAVLPHMRRGGAKRIVNISSIGGRVAVPHLLPYSASKFALTGLSEGLHAELAREGIRVTTVSPGLMRTGSTYNASFKGRHRQEFAWFHLASSVPGLSIDATRAARQIVDACRHGDAALTITLPARLSVLLNAAWPEGTARLMALANRVLPAADPAGGHELRRGWQSVSRSVPSAITALSDRASVANNEWPPDRMPPSGAYVSSRP